MILTTTFKLLRKAGACTERYKFLKTALKGVEDTESINLLTILETNGINDALWALNATAEDCEKIARMMAADFAEMALTGWTKHYPEDKRPALAIHATRDFANGLITDEARSAAESAARSAAAWSATWSAARSAACSAAWSAARSAAESGAWSAAESAARSAAWSAAESGAESAAWSAARSAQAEIFKCYCQPEVMI